MNGQEDHVTLSTSIMTKLILTIKLVLTIKLEYLTVVSKVLDNFNTEGQKSFPTGWWCSGILSGLLRRRSGVQIPDPPILEKCAKGICLCNLLRSTQPNDRETVIEG